jgi:hypothetical protein
MNSIPNEFELRKREIIALENITKELKEIKDLFKQKKGSDYMKTDFVALTKKVMKEVNTDMEWEQIIEYALRVGFEAGKKFEDNVQRPIWRKKIENEIENAECETAEKIFAELEKEAEMQDYDGEDIAFIYLSKWTKFKSRFVGKKESEL